WGSSSIGGDGDVHLTGDASNVAPRLQDLFKGIGANNELWSGVLTQYCEGVSSGTVTCPDGASHVAYPTGGAFAGAWADTSGAAPTTASAGQIAGEAIAAAAHFGNTNG